MHFFAGCNCTALHANEWRRRHNKPIMSIYLSHSQVSCAANTAAVVAFAIALCAERMAHYNYYYSESKLNHKLLFCRLKIWILTNHGGRHHHRFNIVQMPKFIIVLQMPHTTMDTHSSAAAVANSYLVTQSATMKSSRVIYPHQLEYIYCAIPPKNCLWI